MKIISTLQKIITVPGMIKEISVEVTVNSGLNEVTHVVVSLTSSLGTVFCSVLDYI